MIELQDVDLNLLVIFQLMYKERKTGVVAEQLNLSQPAVSHAIGRLRRLFNDELFERTARGMRPTPFSDNIYYSISQGLSTLHDGINFQDKFDPNDSSRMFKVVMTDLGEMYILPRLLDYLAKHAPTVSISTVREADGSLRDDLESGNMDLALGLIPQLEAGFYQRRLFEQRYVCLMRKGHPLSKGEFSLERFSEAEHIVIEAKDTGHVGVEKCLKKSGIARVIRLQLPNFMSAPYIVAQTDLIATVPETLAMTTKDSLGLEVREHPVEIPPAQINLFWHKRYHQDSGNMWLRNVLYDIIPSN